MSHLSHIKPHAHTRVGFFDQKKDVSFICKEKVKTDGTDGTMGQVNNIIKENPSHVKKVLWDAWDGFKNGGFMKSTWTPPSDWQLMPRECRELFQREGSACLSARFVPEIQSMLDNGEIEVEFRVKSSGGPDRRNRWWWRAKEQRELF